MLPMFLPLLRFNEGARSRFTQKSCCMIKVTVVMVTTMAAAAAVLDPTVNSKNHELSIPQAILPECPMS